MHRRETLLKNVQAKLERIMPNGAGFNFSGKLRSVQRYKHSWKDAYHAVNNVSDIPLILIRTTGESRSDPREHDTFARRIDLDLEWVFRGGTADDEDLIAAIQDVERALFGDPGDPMMAFGVGATEPDWLCSLIDPVANMPTDGFHFVLSLTYETQIGDPSQGV